MPVPMSSSWQLVEHQVKTPFAGGEGYLDLERPEEGFRWQGPQQESLQLLRFGDAARGKQFEFPVEAYVRKEDLVINYGGRKMLPFDLQVYWRRQSYPAQADFNALEWILAVQTDCLDIQSQLVTSTTGLAASEIFHLPLESAKTVEPVESDSELCAAESTGCVLVRLGEMSYIELIHPQDFLALQVVRSEATSAFAMNRTIFDCPLEKGVIVRARLRGLCVPRAEDVAMLRDAYQRFIHDALPLTT